MQLVHHDIAHAGGETLLATEVIFVAALDLPSDVTLLLECLSALLRLDLESGSALLL